MAAHKYIDRICLAAALFSLLLSLLFVNGEALGIQSASRVMGYENRLFDTSRVHAIDIVMDGWDDFLDTCEDEEYASCAVVIDGEAYKNVGLRAKGNTSLSTVSRLDSDRYSFKIEFDHYDSGKTYYGLDKLSLNNVIQDNTYMKDYLTYRLMAEFEASAPLCSYAYITVNGEDWGLYLAIEAIEDSFLQRNYGQDHGALYKPDSMSFGGGRGNGREFDFENFDQDDFDFSAFPHGDFDMSVENLGNFKESDVHNFDPQNFNSDGSRMDDLNFTGLDFSGGRGGMGSSDVKLQYIDNAPDSYSNIFSNAKTDITDADQARLIRSLEVLGGGGDVSGVVDIDQVLRYFVVHNFVVNGDSYTGSMVHNYYLYEEDGRLSMLPWDYNLAFGSFMGGSASGAVNDPIDSPLSVTGDGDRPMADWIFSSETYTQLYHQYFKEFLDTVDPGVIIGEAYALIASYVEKDPTKFCTVEEFEAGVDALSAFCALRAQSVSGQLAGTIPSTSEGQSAAPDALVDASSLALSDMGTMNNGGGFIGFARTDADDLSAFDGADCPQPSEEGSPPAPGSTVPFQPGEEDGQSAIGSAAPTLPGGEHGQRLEGAQAGNFSGGFPGGNRFPGGGIQDNAPTSGGAPGSGADSGTSLFLLGISALALLAGLAVAFKFKR